MARKRPPKSVRTSDAFVNPRTRTGRGMGNLASAGHYAFQFWTRNRVQLEAAYRGSWIIGRAVDAVAEDMTRAGVDIRGSVEPHDTSALFSEMAQLGVWSSISDLIKWARLYGGGLAIIMIDGQDPSTPLDLNSIGPGQFKGLYAIDRWIVNPDYSDAISDFGPALGQPKYYTVIPDADAYGGKVIHHSRVVRMEGVRLPMYQRQYENGWGMSIVERIFDVLTAFDSTTMGTAQLVYQARIRVMKIKGYRQVMGGTSDAAQRGILKQLDNIREWQSNEGMSVIDSEDDFEAHQYAFSGLDSVLQQMAQQISGATGIPMTRLMGQSPAGFSSGDMEIRQYYDGIAQQQEAALRRGVNTILHVLFRSVLGKDPPDDFDFVFGSLWGMSDEQKANIFAARTNAVVGAFNAGLIDRAAGLAELRAGSELDGGWNTVTEEMIEEAENEPPPLGENADPPPGSIVAPPDQTNEQLVDPSEGHDGKED